MSRAGRLPHEHDPLPLLRHLVKQLGSQKAAAEHLGCSQAYVCDILQGRRGFSDAMLARLGLRRVIVETKA